ncbi:MAG: hypothetical protein RLZZ592_2712 [Pseudomonadota bacterium]|jgi:DNA-binding response OmpR family regulator
MERPAPHDFPVAPVIPGNAPASWHLLLAGLPAGDTARLQTLMRGYGHRVSIAHGPAQVQSQLMDEDIDVLLHGSTPALPIDALARLPCRPVRICLVDRDEADARIEALEAGADDCLSRPYAPRELLARVAAALRRRHAPAGAPAAQASEPPPRLVSFGDWHYERAARRLTVPGGERVELSPAEARLLGLFLDHPGTVLSREQLLETLRVTAADLETDERSIDLRVSRLRQKMRDDPRQPRAIRTLRGVGYLFEPQHGR